MNTDQAITLLATSYVSKEILLKFLGPSAEFYGYELKNCNELLVKKIKEIFQKSIKKIGLLIDKPYKIPYKVIKEVITNADAIEDELLIEYYSGLLASSRTENRRNDMAMSLLVLLKGLSTYTIRSHYIFYKICYLIFHGAKGNIEMRTESEKFKIFIPFEVYFHAMDLSEENPSKIFSHCINSLAQHDLIEMNYSAGPKLLLSKNYPSIDFETDGIIVAPSPKGIELFLSVYGHGNNLIEDFFSLVFDDSEFPTIEILNGFRKLHNEQNKENLDLVEESIKV